MSAITTCGRLTLLISDLEKVRDGLVTGKYKYHEYCIEVRDLSKEIFTLAGICIEEEERQEVLRKVKEKKNERNDLSNRLHQHGQTGDLRMAEAD